MLFEDNGMLDSNLIRFPNPSSNWHFEWDHVMGGKKLITDRRITHILENGY